MRYGMIETQHIGMQAQALAWIIQEQKTGSGS